MSESEEMDALRLFGDAMADISEIALGRCCNTDVGVIAGQPQPRSVGGLEPPSLVNVRKYDGYYCEFLRPYKIEPGWFGSRI